MFISGFTLVRNARTLDYPFLESVRSALPLCEELIINCGDSSDDTLSLCRQLEREAPGKVRTLQTVWERENQAGGSQLRCQTDRAMAECRGDWCLYIQADEVIHEDDLPLIRDAIRRADERPEVEGILFDYLHFYGNFSHVITGRNWYRREVRALKNHRDIRSFRDAQGFRREGRRLKVIPSGARIFHYGYVRSPVSLGKKTQEMAQWWGESPARTPERLEPRRHVGLKRFQGSHPALMRSRVDGNSLYPDPSRGRRVWTAKEMKNALTVMWESIIPLRIGEFRNYEIVKGK